MKASATTVEDLLAKHGLVEKPAPPIKSAPVEPVVEHQIKEYPGDITDDEGPLRSEWQTLDFESPALLVSAFDEYLLNKQVTLHPWQIEESTEVAKPYTKANPYRLALCASNGSGKDKYFVAPFAIWFALTKKQSLCIITSSSGVQLTAQTENYIASLARAVNAVFNQNIFKIRQRYIKCNLSGSEIRLFATDEEGKAEGYHPMTPVSEMAIIVNEAKSVDDIIFRALKRCSGYNYWMEVSTPGVPSGQFYRSCTNSRLGYRFRRVTSFDCHHISKSEIEHDKMELGEHSALFRSKHLALFTSVGGQLIISPESFEKLFDKDRKPAVAHQWKHWPKRVGIDLSAGGDENSVYIVQGNCDIASTFFRQNDTTITAVIIDDFLTRNGISKDCSDIYADDGHVGHAIIDMLIAKGWKINRVHNQSPALNKSQFGNRGAENWWRVSRLVEEKIIVPPSDEKTVAQLTSRYYEQRADSGRTYLESKKKAKAEGRPSPDRADSYVLCFTGLSIEDFLGDGSVKKTPSKFVGKTADELNEELMQQELAPKIIHLGEHNTSIVFSSDTYLKCHAN